MMGSKHDRIIAACLKQNALFKKWNANRNYYDFHHNHYDWWAFPIDQLSSHGDQYKVQINHLEDFMNNKEFIKALRSNSILLCRSWGYDLEKGQPLKQVTNDQKWQGWPIRLYKMTRSLEIFHQMDIHENAIRYGLSLIDKGYKFTYKHDLSIYFQKFRIKKQA